MAIPKEQVEEMREVIEFARKNGRNPTPFEKADLPPPEGRWWINADGTINTEHF